MAKKPTDETQASAPEEITEEEITAKVRAGLSRAQAVGVITGQRAHDAELAKAAAK
jgi:hypothetical protein